MNSRSIFKGFLKLCVFLFCSGQLLCPGYDSKLLAESVGDDPSKDISEQISFSRTYDQDVIERFLSLLDTKKHSYKDIRHLKNIEQFMLEKIFEYDSNLSDFIKQAWILAEKKKLRIGVRLELFGIYVSQKMYLKDEISKQKIQDFFINYYLVSIMDIIDKYIDENDFGSGVLGASIPFFSVFVGKNRLFESAQELRIKASKMLKGRYPFLDIPIEFFSDSFISNIKGTKEEGVYVNRLFDAVIGWSQKYNNNYPPTEADFSARSKKVGIAKNRIIGPLRVFKNYTEFLDDFYKYAKKKNIVLRERGSLKESDQETKGFISKWNGLFDQIRAGKKNEILKEEFLQACLEWMKLFKKTPTEQVEFLNSKDITTNSFGIYSSSVLGHDKLFYSVYDLQLSLIEYAKKHNERFVVRENIPIDVNQDVKEYILSTTYNWILSHQRLPLMSNFKMDTFEDNVGINVNSFLRVFGFRGYDSILSVVYDYTLDHSDDTKILELFPDRIRNESSSFGTNIKLEEFKSRWSDLFERIKNNEITDCLKLEFMDAVLEWMAEFNNNTFLRSKDLRLNSFGIDIIYVIGQNCLFYSMFEFEQSLIEYAKTKNTSFIVREGVSFNIDESKGVSKKEYVLDMLFKWMQDNKFRRLPERSDFGLDKFSGKVGISYNTSQIVFSSLSYHNLMNELFIYSKEHGVSEEYLKVFDAIDERYVGDPIRRGPRGRQIKEKLISQKDKISEFQILWANEIDTVKNTSADINLRKINFMRLVLDWMYKFNNLEFISSDQLSKQELGINLHDVIGEGRLFYSMFVLEQELILYAKAQHKRFRVREDIPLKIESEDLVGYIMDMITDWMAKYKKIPEVEDFGLDTFSLKVGLTWGSVSGTFGTRDYHKVISLIYQYEVVNRNRQTIINVLKKGGYPKVIDEYRTPKKFMAIYSELVRREIDSAVILDENKILDDCILKMKEN